MSAPFNPSRRLVLAFGASQIVASAFAAENYPSRVIRIVSPSAAGGPTDITARLVADRLSSVLKAQVIVENKPGANGAIGLAEVAKSAPDGYTLLVGYVSANVLNPIFNPNLQFDAVNGFTPITQVYSGAQNLMVHPSVPANNVKEFIEYCKSKSDPVLYGIFGLGSTAHLYGEYLKMLTGINMRAVPFKSATSLFTDMVGGHIQVGFLDSSSARTAINEKTLKGLATTSDERSPGMPNTPTMKEQGVDFGLGGAWQGIFGPAGMPPEIVATLNQEIVKFLREPKTYDILVKGVGQPPAPTTPEQFAQIISNDRAKYKTIVERTGIKVN